ncbi:hypothetical protein B0T22DRAFT_426617 [Podospora appendiculata]|uniref:TRIP4/RQT4 C2HC5-type zinc finger domain-containing protein n=1 Tax=Podospora appendiculata TaxID=314037 RepID=A0AAE0XAE4_9PEZI|nr:hypothetical protein B0T22DRAFT_426617 [Podospora appendiculata]
MSQAQLSRILPLPDDELKQVLDYASALSKDEAAEHFTNLLGDSPQVIDFISSFNSRRTDPRAPPPPRASPAPRTTAAAAARPPPPPPTPSSNQNPPAPDAFPRPPTSGRQKKKKPAIHTPPPREIAPFALTAGTAYSKKDQEGFYISSKQASAQQPTTAGPSNNNTTTNNNASTKPPPPKSTTPAPRAPKPPPSAAGSLVSDLGLPKPKPKPTTTKITIAGGVPMHGASTALSDLDQAIRSLEITTNPSHTTNTPAGIAARRCNCVATRHALLEAAPNCIACGKVICIKEGMGPCTFCGTPLLTTTEVQGMVRELRAERGREKQAADREAHRRADPPRPFALPRALEPSPEEAAALAHRDRLLTFQAQNAQRTTVRDEAADFDATPTGGGGGSMWATPEERALALKKQQKLLREMEWNALPEYEKRRQVVSIDLVGKKVLKKMAKVERPASPKGDRDRDGGGDEEFYDAGYGTAAVLGETSGNRARGTGGAFSRNPLLSGLIKPAYEVKEKGAELPGRKDKSATTWRRVQDNLDDNQAVILDGGVYGGGVDAKGGGDEPACG